jgi:hypothetical protein
MKEKNLRCKFGKIETSNFGNENQDGTQEDMVRWMSCKSSSSLAFEELYMAVAGAELRGLRQPYFSVT